MIRQSRLQRGIAPTIEDMEHRRLLSAGVPSAVFSRAETATIEFLIPPITGTITGTVTQITPLTSKSQEVFYTARGKANIIGDGKGSGHHIIVSKTLKGGATNDTYKSGVATILGNTDTVAIHYSGTGHTNSNGSFTATWSGTAQSVAGENAGLHGSFSARVSGTNRTEGFTIKITIKVKI